MEKIATSGCTLEFVNSSDSGVLTITTAASAFSTISSLGVYRGTVVVTVSGFTNSTVKAGSGAGTFVLTSLCASSDDVGKVLRVNDTATITGTGMSQSSPSTTVSFTTVVKVSDAGQISVSVD